MKHTQLATKIKNEKKAPEESRGFCITVKLAHVPLPFGLLRVGVKQKIKHIQVQSNTLITLHPSLIGSHPAGFLWIHTPPTSVPWSRIVRKLRR
jgi:hypothetical protein